MSFLYLASDDECARNLFLRSFTNPTLAHSHAAKGSSVLLTYPWCDENCKSTRIPFPFWLFLFLRHQQTEIETRSFEHHHSLVHFAHKMQTKPLQDLLNYPQCLANKERETTLICLSIYGNERSSSTLHSARNCQNKLNSSSIDFNLYFETLPSSSPAKHTPVN